MLKYSVLYRIFLEYNFHARTTNATVAEKIGVTAKDTGCESGPSFVEITLRCRHQWREFFIHVRVIRKIVSIITRQIMPSPHAFDLPRT